LGLTDHGVRAVLDVVLTREEDVVSYWDLLVRLWRRYNLTLVVADGVKALDTAISRSGINVARQTCLVHLKRRVDRRVRVLLDLLLSLAESVPTRGSPLLSYLLAPRELWPLLRSNNLAESFNSLMERRRFGKCHSHWRILQISRVVAVNYNLSTCYLIIVIILQESLFLRDMIKYIQ
jgi:putative transposase